MTNKTVSITLSDRVWGRLASRADDMGVRVTELLAMAVQNLVPEPESDRVVLLASSGLSDKEIARVMSLTNEQVARRRRHAGIPANKWAQRRDVA